MSSAPGTPPRFACPNCGSEKIWKPEFAGKHGKCKCGALITVPRSAPVPQGAEPDDPFEAAVAAASAYAVDDEPRVAPAPVVEKPAFVAPPIILEREEADGSVSTVGAVPRHVVRTEVSTMPRRRGLRREEKPVGPPPVSPLHDFILPGVLIAVGVPLCFVAARYPGGGGDWRPVADVVTPVVLNVIGSLVLVIGGVFAASAFGGVAFQEPALRVIYKLCAVALAPGALGQIALLYFGGPGGMENVNGGLMGTFVSIACYVSLMMLLFRLPIGEQFACVFVIFVTRSIAMWAMFRFQGFRSGSDF